MPGRELAVVAALVLTPWASASAQVFPGNDAYWPWPCRTGVMTDPLRDEAGAINERDLVGDEAAPTGLRAVDPAFLYVRLRVDTDPTPSGNARAWGLLVDTDGNASTYEVMLAADGAAQKVYVYTNSSSSAVGDARDPPDALAYTYDWPSNARTGTAPGSNYGGNADYFVELAFPWSDLAAVGITPSTPIRVWAATANTASNGMNGDFACWNGGTDVALDSTWPRTISDPVRDSDGDGFSDATELENGTDPYDPRSAPGTPTLGGGGGCQHGAGGVLALSLLLAAMTWVRSARRILGGRPSRGGG